MQPRPLTPRQARENAMLTQGELAQRAGLSPRTVQRIEHGTAVPNLSTRRVLLVVLRRAVEEHTGTPTLLSVQWPTGPDPAMREAA